MANAARLTREDFGVKRRGAKAPAIASPPGDAAGKSCDDYFDLWNKAREGRIRTTADERGRWKHWISPHLGPKPIASVTTRDLEELVSSLDKAVRDGRIAWKTAIHVWGCVTKLFDDATRGKDLTLRCLATNPARDVRGPDRGHDRASAFLFPGELDALLSKETIPLRRRAMYALAVYLGCRAGELRGLDWDGVHEEQGFVHVHRSVDGVTGKAKTTKTGRSRRVPIEPALLPLLAKMREESGGEGKVVTAPSWHLAPLLRADLRHAGCERADLEADDETRRPIDFHDLRHTYGTWRAIRGDELTKISRAMGHSTTAMTERYVNEAEAFDLGGTAVFGPLPSALLSETVFRRLVGGHKRLRSLPETLWSRRGSNP
jgi:integrase